MKRLKASPAFVENETQILAIAQTAERFGRRPSELLKIEDDVLALDFDNTCNFRLILLEIERQKRELAAMNGEEYKEPDGIIKGRITKDTQYW